MMKLAAFTLLAATAHGDAHLGAKCGKGCARSSCDDATAQKGLLEVDTKLMTDTKTDGTGAKKQHAAQGSAEHVPFVCKAKSSGKRRNLAGHVQLTLRVAVAGVNGSATNLDNMKKADHTEYIMVANAAGSHGRALGAHAKTLMYAKGWEKDGLKEQNACFEFDLLKADKVTKIKATSHSTTKGTFLSNEIAIADLKECVEKMVSPGDARRRQLAAHAGNCKRIENGPSPCPKSPAPAASSATTYSVVTAAVVGVLALFL
jgi:hypothetical protein